MPVVVTANNDVPCAVCCDNPNRCLDDINGIIINPPPIPARDPHVPAAVPIKNDSMGINKDENLDDCVGGGGGGLLLLLLEACQRFCVGLSTR